MSATVPATFAVLFDGCPKRTSCPPVGIRAALPPHLRFECAWPGDPGTRGALPSWGGLPFWVGSSLREPQAGDRFTTTAGRELGQIISVDPGKQLTGITMGAFTSYVLVPYEHDATRGGSLSAGDQ